MAYTLRNWSLVVVKSRASAAGASTAGVLGDVSAMGPSLPITTTTTFHLTGFPGRDHPQYKPDYWLRTSRILSAAGRIVKTLNSEYELVGSPSSAYLDFLINRGYEFDYNDPIKIGVA